jgi:hypothetical protein
MKAFCPFRRDIIGPAVFEGNILLLLQFLPIFPVGLRLDPTRCALTERIYHPAKRRMLPVLHLDPAIGVPDPPMHSASWVKLVLCAFCRTRI